MLAPGERPGTYLVRGRGVELTLGDGRTVIDGGSLSSCILGHCHPEVVRAVQDAAEHVYVGHGDGYAPRDQAADDLLEVAFADESWADGVAFFISSSEAADLGLLLAQTLKDRTSLVARERGYHGGVGLARAVSTHPLWDAKLAPITDGEIATAPGDRGPIRRLPVPECGLGDVSPDHDCSSTCLRDAPELLDGAAAVIMDYTQGAVCPSPAYQDALAVAAREAGAYWIADETVTAFGRLGRGFAFQRGATRPDMVTLGKGITGGAAPGGALVLSRAVVDEIGDRRWTTSSTFRGHPLTVAAISATMRVLRDEQLVARAAKIGPELGRDVRAIAARHPSVLRVVGEGMMWQLYLDVPDSLAEGTWTGGGNLVSPAELVHREGLNHGAFIGMFSGQCVWLIPPLVITPDQLAVVLEALDAALVVADRSLEGATV
jgi:4-aminobutyrate aminotransferase-like enzyme